MLTKRIVLHCPKRLFYFVEIYSSEKSMQEAVLCLAGRCSKNIRALCLRYQCDSTYKKYRALGTIFLQEADRTDIPVVVHELTHAAVGYCNHAGLMPIQAKRKKHSDEEKFAELLQSLLSQYLEQMKPSFE